MIRIVKMSAVILFPLAVSVGIDLRPVPFSVSGHNDRRLFASTAFDVERLILKYRSFLKQHLISRPERDLVDLVQCFERLVFRHSIV